MAMSELHLVVNLRAVQAVAQRRHAGKHLLCRLAEWRDDLVAQPPQQHALQSQQQLIR